MRKRNFFWQHRLKLNIKKLSLADKANIHDLYERSVQNVEHEIEFMQETYQQLKTKSAYSYREDFCGTANSSYEWIKQGDDYDAIGIDNDESVLLWAKNNRLIHLPDKEFQRIKIIEADVMTVKSFPVDILSAFNFSYFLFDSREQLCLYFKRSLETLKSDGIFFLDLFGGPEAHQELIEKTEHEDFTYIWHQSKFHPLSNFIECSISYDFPDGSIIEDAFIYKWRLWSAPEIKELLLEAGFARVTFYWEGEDDEGEGNGEFLPNNKGEPDLAWIIYIVAEK
jgi:hypothetical protein